MELEKEFINFLDKNGDWTTLKRQKGKLKRDKEFVIKALLNFEEPIYKSLNYANSQGASKFLYKLFGHIIKDKPKGVTVNRYLSRLLNISKCTVCKKFKYIPEFAKANKNWDGTSNICLICKAEERRLFRSNNPDYDKEYYKNNKEKIQLSQKKYKENNKEKIQLSKKEYRENNIEKIKIKEKEWRKNNKEKKRLTNKKYYECNKEKIQLQQKKWREENSAKVQTLNNLKKERIKKAITNNYSQLEEERVRALKNHLEQYLQIELHLDHIISISNGGNHDKYNWQILTAEDNMKKHNKDETKVSLIVSNKQILMFLDGDLDYKNILYPQL